MKTVDYLLIGGGLTCAMAARQLREIDANGTIMLVGSEPHVPYNRPPLTKEFLRGKKPREKTFVKPAEFYQQRGIELVLGTAVTQLDPGAKTAALSNGTAVQYRKALLATGGTPVEMDIPGARLPGVHYLRTLDDSTAIAEEARKYKRAVVVGGGFIGIETAASLTQLGVEVTVIVRGPQIWPRVASRPLADYVQQYCAAKGVRFLFDDSIREIKGADRVASVLTGSGRDLLCDFVCVGIGIRPAIELARQGGLTVGSGVVANEYLQTSAPDVFAGGDIVDYPDPISGRRRRVEHWGHADYCGRLAGENMTGRQKPFDLVSYFWSDLFDLHLESAGDESEHDEILMRGRMDEPSFIALFLRQNRLAAYFAVNADDKEFAPLQGLIKSRKDVSAARAKLSDPSFSPAELV